MKCKREKKLMLWFLLKCATFTKVCPCPCASVHLHLYISVLTGRTAGSRLQSGSCIPKHAVITISLLAPRCATSPVGQFSTALAMMNANWRNWPCWMSTAPFWTVRMAWPSPKRYKKKKEEEKKAPIVRRINENQLAINGIAGNTQTHAWFCDLGWF